MAKVVIYVSAFCGFCRSAKALLDKKGVSYQELDLTHDPAGREALVEKSGGQRTVPQIFIDEKPIGGYTDLAALDRSGELDKLLAR